MADNLEELNRQLEAAKQKVTEAENNYYETREQLSKMGDEYYKTTLLTVKEQEHVIEEYKRLRETLKKENERRSVLNKALDEETKVEKQKIEKAKQEVTEVQKKIEEARKPKGFNAFLDRIGFKTPTEDDLALQRRARSRIEGVSNLVSGNFGAAFRDLTSSIPKLANLVRTGWFATVQLSIQGLIAFDKQLSKTKKEISSITGGVFSPYQNNYVGAALYQGRLEQGLASYGLRDKALEIGKTVIGSTPIGDIYTKPGQLNQKALLSRTINQGAAMNYMGSLGISSDSIEKMFRISRTIEGMSEEGALASQYRLAQIFRKSRFMTEGEGAQQSLALFEQTKSLGVNFEWASRTVAKFDKALQLGEVSLNDFAAITRGLKGADKSKAAGLSEMIYDYAIRNGIKLPKEFMQAGVRGRALYLQTREGLSNKGIQQALKGSLKEIQGGMNYGNTILDEAGALQDVLSGIPGANISPDMALNIQRTGNCNPILGGRSGVNPDDITNQASSLLKESKEFYEGTRSYVEAGTEGVKTFINELKQGILVKIDKGAWFDLFMTASTMTLPGINAVNIKRYQNIGQTDIQNATMTNN